jgi:hypothetical protein
MPRILHSLFIAATLVAVCGGSALAQSDRQTRFATVAVGSSFVRSINDTGSYGNGSSTTTVTRAPNSEWKGQTVGVWKQSAGPTLLINPVNGAFVAFVNGETPVVSFEPAAGWPWPLEVGKTWTMKPTLTLHSSNQLVPLEITNAVEAYEDLTIPAGTFKAFRVRSVDNVGNEDVNWFNTDLTVLIKQKLTRTAKHAAGPGVRETELLSASIRHE